LPCSVHILDANGALKAWLDRIRAAFSLALPRISNRIPVGDVDVVVYNDSDRVVPKLGIGGFCTSPRRLYLPLDVDHADLSSNFEARFQGFLAHELHHCARRRIIGYADTLAQSLVTEGLACCFEAELPDGSAPIYATAITGAELERVRQLARPALHQPIDGWGEWFFGELEPQIPTHAGYSLGYDIVSRWLRRNRSSASACYAVPATAIYGEA
jgi:uncharacterized protein YjaZ